MTKESINLKSVTQYMNIAKQIAKDNKSCYSSSIGTVIVDPVKNQILSTGYNGPPPGLPHNDTEWSINNFLVPQLEKLGLGDKILECETNKHEFVGCGQCPRRKLGYGSGQKLELCSCTHSEANAIVRCGRDLLGCDLYCYCGIPCLECTKLIISAGIKRIFFLADKNYVGNYGNYSPDVSESLLRKGGVNLIPIKIVGDKYEICDTL